MGLKQVTVNLGVLFLGAGLPEPESEMFFHPTRKWRFDLCWPAQKVALERQGGTWGKGKECSLCGQRRSGRHSGGAGYRNDSEKLFEAQMLGWLVIYATADMMEDGSVFRMVEEALVLRGWRK